VLDLAILMANSVNANDSDRATALTAQPLRHPDADAVRHFAEGILAPRRDDVWRRWFVGPAQMVEGTEVATSDLAVVVIGLRAQEDLGAAVASLRAQHVAEIVVVNSGGGPAREKLGPHLDHIRLIEVDAPMLVGAARNVGIDASHAPFVAFLAGDCTAAPGWIEARLKAHLAGARAVASAVAPPEGAGYWTRAAHLFLFGLRSPRLPSALAQRYGASYDRRVFAEAGYFNPVLRIGEDSDFAARLAGRVSAEWNRGVVTVHDGPRGPWEYIREMHGRGYRAARQHLHRRGGSSLAAFGRLTSERTELALRVAREGWRLSAAEVERLRPAIRLGAVAYAAGVWRGFVARDRALSDLARSQAALARGRLNAAVTHATRAVTRNAEDIPTLLYLIDLLRRDTAQTVWLGETLRRVGLLSAFDQKRQLALCEWLLERDMFAEAVAFAALARLGTPCDASLHVQIAEAAAERGDMAAYNVLAHDALSIDPSLANQFSHSERPLRRDEPSSSSE
jgi:hypothetical protein